MVFNMSMYFVVVFFFYSCSGGERHADDASNKNLQFLPISKALEKAKSDSRVVFLNITQKRCGYCRKMKRETFRDPLVKKILREVFIPGELWIDPGRRTHWEGRAVSTTYVHKLLKPSCRGVPCYLFLKGDAKRYRLADQAGYMPPDSFIEFLKKNAPDKDKPRIIQWLQERKGKTKDI